MSVRQKEKQRKETQRVTDKLLGRDDFRSHPTGLWGANSVHSSLLKEIYYDEATKALAYNEDKEDR